MFDWIANPDIWASLITLTLLEVVLGIDNIIFISIAAERLPVEERPRARFIGLALALFTRIALLASIVWIIRLTEPVITVMEHDLSWRDIILFVGGLFLIAKGVHEIHETVEGEEDETGEAVQRGKPAGFASVIIQIILLDVVFSFDSILTAVGIANHLPVMIAAVVISILIMMVASGPIAGFVSRHLSVKILAVAFLIMIGFALVADGLGFHIPKGYLYFSVAFAMGVEAVTLMAKGRRIKKRTAQ